jgi:hypothetical protein
LDKAVTIGHVFQGKIFSFLIKNDGFVYYFTVYGTGNGNKKGTQKEELLHYFLHINLGNKDTISFYFCGIPFDPVLDGYFFAAPL